MLYTNWAFCLEPDLNSLRGDMQRRANLDSSFPSNSSRKAGGWKITRLEELPVHFCIRNAYFIYFIHFIAMSGAEFPEWQCKSKVSEGLTKISSKKGLKLHINCFVNTCSDNGLGRKFMDCNPLRITTLSVGQNTPLKESSEYSKHWTLEQAGKQKHLLKPTEALPWNTQNRKEY